LQIKAIETKQRPSFQTTLPKETKWINNFRKLLVRSLCCFLSIFVRETSFFFPILLASWPCLSPVIALNALCQRFIFQGKKSWTWNNSNILAKLQLDKNMNSLYSVQPYTCMNFESVKTDPLFLIQSSLFVPEILFSELHLTKIIARDCYHISQFMQFRDYFSPSQDPHKQKLISR